MGIHQGGQVSQGRGLVSDAGADGEARFETDRCSVTARHMRNYDKVFQSGLGRIWAPARKYSGKVMCCGECVALTYKTWASDEVNIYNIIRLDTRDIASPHKATL